MKYHLRHADGSVSDIGDYTSKPADRPGCEWVEGIPPNDAVIFGTQTLPDQLNAIFETLAPEYQADLAPLKAAVKLELDQGRKTIARLIVERAPIPADLEPLRTEMLAQF